MISRFINPGQTERNFLNYLKESKAKISQSKTIAKQVLNNSKYAAAVNTVTFFTGEPVPVETNVTGSFERPESEHFLIYGIRFYSSKKDFRTIPTSSVFQRGDTDLTPEINNAIVNVECNSIRVLKNVPMDKFSFVNTSSNNLGTMLLDEPILWQGQQELLITISTKDGSNFDDVSLRFDLVGIGLI